MVLSLKKYSIDFLPIQLKKKLSNYEYVFNPSFVEHENINYLALRVYCEVEQAILAYVYCWYSDNERIYEINISEELEKELDIDKVADPKLFIMNNSVWGTFNTGYSKEQNKLGIFELCKAKLISSYLCFYPSRIGIEKNWAFFYNENSIYALYGITPLTILKGEFLDNNKVIFEKYFVDKKTFFHNCSIGTPLLEFKNEYIFIAHRKIIRNRKRLYIGRPFTLYFGENTKLKASNLFLFHSLKSLFGSRKKFNDNLISCTYFSGIFNKNNNKIILGYGINDLKWNLIALAKDKIWH
ncbi:hypothetical protein [Seonamhaeicola maritimus]|uniref:Uncharacterized protein n=1 Tax=Seonamhaeicola maritimus TaxID=2591822 RepID=A0A5C7GK73_9FLAO|nr:hypothetical protein [Seonamhaeicola maritimus]TXG38866.1 hypothetical protein FUA22_02965 [Seonamhaeicola maritimus]